MCSIGVFLGVWLFSFIKYTSNCRGVLERRRTKSVSVVILRGIRLSTTIFKGRISWLCALLSSITKMFSCLSSSMAGNLSGNLNGIVQFLSFDLCAKLRIFSEIHKKRMPKLLLTSLYSYLFTNNKNN